MNPEAILAFAPPDIPLEVTAQRAILYALGLGIGERPTDPDQLRYVYERDLVAFPTLPLVLGSPGMWFRDAAFGIDAGRVLHAEQSLRNHRPLRIGEALTGRNRVVSLEDRGAGKGALLVVERQLTDAAGTPVSTARATFLLRGNGGYGGPPPAPRPPEPPPERAPDAVLDWVVMPQAALLYRLSGDMNPLHVDPEAAAPLGLPRPLLHGLCTLGMAAWALLRAAGRAGAPTLPALRCRFAAPVFPGDALRLRLWTLGNGAAAFEVEVPERGALALAQGHAEL